MAFGTAGTGWGFAGFWYLWLQVLAGVTGQGLYVSVRSPVPWHTRKGDHSEEKKHCFLLNLGGSKVRTEDVKAVGNIIKKKGEFGRKSPWHSHIINFQVSSAGTLLLGKWDNITVYLHNFYF